MPTKAETYTHRLINKERRNHGLSRVKWSPYLYQLAKNHAKRMAKSGHLFHSNRFAFLGGECVSGGKGDYSPRAFLRSWMKSEPHREYLLHPESRRAAVGIAKSKHGTYAAWSFSNSTTTDYLSAIKRFILKILRIFK